MKKNQYFIGLFHGVLILFVCLSNIIVSFSSYAMTDCSLEGGVKIAYLGPRGTYSEQAAHLFAKMEPKKFSGVNFCPEKTIGLAIEKLVSGECHFAVVPIENSIEGGVTATNDALWQSGITNCGITICSSLVMPIRHALLCAGEQELKSISKVYSHPQALGQCRGWLQKNICDADQISTSSTAEATEKVKGDSTCAAIASVEAGALHGLKVLSYPINDILDNYTKFLLLTRLPNSIDQISHTSIAFSLKKNKPGSLVEALRVFEDYGINMSKIESRPSKKALGEYIFFIDLETTTEEISNVNEALSKISPLCDRLVNFGSYKNTEVEKNDSERQ